MDRTKLTFPAPWRESVPIHGRFTTQPWSAAGVIECKAAGGWFKVGDANYDFQDKFARMAASMSLEALETELLLAQES